MKERRTWLRELYPNGIGMGDVILELLSVSLSSTPDEETQLRRLELHLILNHMNRLNITPIFPEKFDNKFYL